MRWLIDKLVSLGMWIGVELIGLGIIIAFSAWWLVSLCIIVGLFVIVVWHWLL